MSIQETVTTPLAAKAAAGASVASAGSALLFGLNANEIGVFLSVACAFCAMVLSAWINWHFKNEHLKLAKAVVERNTLMHLPTSDEICSTCPVKKRGDE